MTTSFAVKMQTCGSVAILLAIIFTGANAVPYSKYGRKCTDIGCRSDETCQMKEDPCTSSSSQCGLYPSCVSLGASETCRSKICPSGQYCKTEGGVPTCVDTKSGLAYDPPGIPPVNGRNVPNSNYPPVPADPWSSGSRYANSNPYANANAPPAEDVNRDHSRPAYPNNNPGYPPYPTNNNNNGFPPYPVQPNYNNNRPLVDQYGRPIYPQNTNYNSRPPVDQFGNSIYPTQRPAYPYPQQNLPQYNSGWGGSYNTNSIYRRNAASLQGVSVFAFVSSFVLIALFGIRVPA